MYQYRLSPSFSHTKYKSFHHLYLSNLSLNKNDIEGIIDAVEGITIKLCRSYLNVLNMDFEDILAFVASNSPEGLDIKALKIELKANNFYRGNPYVDIIGSLLGFTKEQLDLFFENGDYLQIDKFG